MRLCYGVVYLRPDGSDAGRTDYYTNKDAATRRFDKATRVHGAYTNGAPRWVFVTFIETMTVDA